MSRKNMLIGWSCILLGLLMLFLTVRNPHVRGSSRGPVYPIQDAIAGGLVLLLGCLVIWKSDKR